MESNSSQIEFTEKLVNFYNLNKLKIISITIFLLVIIASVAFIKLNQEKKNNLIAEDYIKAGILLSSGMETESLKIFEKILNSDNKIYSILALNTILEKNLMTDKKKILTYFSKVENTIKSNEQKDLLIFKKSLFLLKNNQKADGENLLQDLINRETQFKSLSEEIIK